MAAISIDFWSLNAMSRDANRLAQQAEDYANSLTRKVANQISSVAGGGSGSLSDACYYIQAKVQKLREKKERYASYAKKVTALYEKAQRVDRQVKQEIAQSYKNFVEVHPNLKVSWWKSVMINFMVDFKNANPLYQMIGNGVSLIMDKMSSTFDNIRYWWKCEGGKELAKFVVSIVECGVAIVLLVAAFGPISGILSFIVTVAAVVSATIALVNAAFKVYTHYKSWKSAEKGDNAWSRIYGEQETASDCIRAHNFGSKSLNRFMDGFAFGLDFTKTVCDAIGTVAAFGKLASNITAINNYFKESGGLRDFMQEPKWIDKMYQDGVTGEWSTVKTLKLDDKGNVEMQYTVRSVFRGIKAYVTNDGSMTETGVGLRTMLKNNFEIDKTAFKKSFGLRQFKETVKYNVSESRIAVIFRGNPTGDPNVAAKIANAWKSLKNDYKVTSFSDLKKYTNAGKSVAGVVNTLDDIFNKKEIDIGNKVQQKVTKTLIGTSANVQMFDKIGFFKDFSTDKNGKPTGLSKGIIGDFQKLFERTHTGTNYNQKTPSYMPFIQGNSSSGGGHGGGGGGFQRF